MDDTNLSIGDFITGVKPLQVSHSIEPDIKNFAAIGGIIFIMLVIYKLVT